MTDSVGNWDQVKSDLQRKTDRPVSSENGGTVEQVTGAGETSTADPLKTAGDEDKREIGSHYNSATGGQKKIETPSAGGHQHRNASFEDQPHDQSANGESRLGSASPGREADSDRLDRSTGQDNRPNNKSQVTKLAGHH